MLQRSYWVIGEALGIRVSSRHKFPPQLAAGEGGFSKWLFDFGMILENQNFILPPPQLPASHHGYTQGF